jgi:hypothetical protein
MPNPRPLRTSKERPSQRLLVAVAVLAAVIFLAAFPARSAPPPLRERLKTLPFQIAYESYLNDNWEIFVVNADGSNPVNVTRTPKEHEHYPLVSSDGAKTCFVVDQGEDRDTIRSLCVMDTNGKNRRKLVDGGREPFWTPDNQRIGFLPQEYPKFNVMDYYTMGMSFFDLATGRIEPHPRGTNLHHLYNPCFAPNGKWILATVNAGMGFEHSILLIAAHDDRVIDLQIPGCRAWLSPDGKQIAWGADENEIAVAPINLEADSPKVGERRLRIQDALNRVIHVDWSPDGRFLCFSRGPAGKGDPTKPGTFLGSCGLVGVYAPGWNLCVVSAERSGVLDLNAATEADFVMVTSNGLSNKEPCWFRSPRQPE